MKKLHKVLSDFRNTPMFSILVPMGLIASIVDRKSFKLGFIEGFMVYSFAIALVVTAVLVAHGILTTYLTIKSRQR
jgi:hypothetical protein